MQFQTLHRDLTHMTQQLQLHPCIMTTLWLGMRAIRNDTTYPEILQDVPLPVHSPITQQSRIGWEQLYYGRVSRAWAVAIDQLHPHIPQTGTQVLIMIQKQIWKYFLDIWTLPNQHLHQHAARLNIPNYRQAAATLYEQRDRLPPTAQDALYRQPLEAILELPALQLEQWVIRGHKYYNQQLKAIKQQASLRTQDIQNFLRPQLDSCDDLQPP